MIKLSVEEYCHFCLDFTPDVTYPICSQNANGDIIQSDTIVRCKNRKRCANIKRYLERQSKPKSDETSN